MGLFSGIGKFLSSAGGGALVGGLGGSLLSGAFGRQSAKSQMNFQQRMSDTAHRREATDLEAAGLNRILSVTGGPGASSPGGAMPTTPDFAGSAIMAARAEAEIKNIRSLTELNEAKKGAIGGATGVGTRLEELMNYVGTGTEQFIQKLLDEMESNKGISPRKDSHSKHKHLHIKIKGKK